MWQKCPTGNKPAPGLAGKVKSQNPADNCCCTPDEILGFWTVYTVSFVLPGGMSFACQTCADPGGWNDQRFHVTTPAEANVLLTASGYASGSGFCSAIFYNSIPFTLHRILDFTNIYQDSRVVVYAVAKHACGTYPTMDEYAGHVFAEPDMGRVQGPDAFAYCPGTWVMNGPCSSCRPTHLAG